MKNSARFLFPWILALAVAVAWAEPPVPASQFEWPTSSVRIRLISVDIDCYWREGRPVAPRDKVARLLKISEQGSAEVDLIEELAQKRWMITREREQTIVARPPIQALASSPGGSAPIRETTESKLAVANFIKICAQRNKQWIRNHPQQELIDSIGADLARQARRPIPWTFAIVRDSEPNAACTGEGMVYINEGLLKLLDRDELAGVLSHSSSPRTATKALGVKPP